MKKLLLGILMVCLLLFGALLPLLLPWRCPVNRAACERVKEGMTQAEVEEALGRPAGDYRTRPGGKLGAGAEGVMGRWRADQPELDVGLACWRGDHAELNVLFERGVAVKVGLTQVEPANVSPVELARWRLVRLKKRWFP
jgi:hypothetical protein